MLWANLRDARAAGLRYPNIAGVQEVGRENCSLVLAFARQWRSSPQ